MKIKNDPSGIDFKNLSNSNVVWNIPIKGSNYRLGSQKNEFEYAAEDGVFPIFNAVEIDWNGAQLKNGSTVKATLNTTGEMLSILQTA